MTPKSPALTCMLLALLAFPVSAVERTWTNSEGKQLIGELLEDKGDNVVLQIKGKNFNVPLDKLSENDRKWMEAHREELAAKKKADAELAGTLKTFEKKANQRVTFHVKYPKSYSSAKPAPMLILFSTFANGKDSVKSFEGPCDAVGWICVGCDTFRNGVEGALEDPLFEELLPIIEKNVVHDPAQLYMGGMSGGAMRALGYSGQFKRPWKGIVACGGWLGKDYESEYGENMKIAWINGDKDAGAGSWFGRDSDFLKKKFKCESKLFEFPGGHVIAPPEVLTEALRWLDSEAQK